MGTRSLTTVIRHGNYEGKKWSEKIVTMYRQMDGYPSGMGVDLAEFLNGGKLVNGIAVGNTETKTLFNGGSCLAAAMVAYFKDGPGGYYLHRGGSYGHGEDYRYEVIVDEDNKSILMKVIDIGWKSRNKTLFLGTPEAFLASELSK